MSFNFLIMLHILLTRYLPQKGLMVINNNYMKHVLSKDMVCTIMFPFI